MPGSQCPDPSGEKRQWAKEPPGQPRPHPPPGNGAPQTWGRRPAAGNHQVTSAPPCSALGLSVPAWEVASTRPGLCTARQFSQWRLPCFPVQMYIALISLHALIMVGFHFLHCFEEDWASDAHGTPAPGGCMTGPGGGLCLSWCQGPTSFY